MLSAKNFPVFTTIFVLGVFFGLVGYYVSQNNRKSDLDMLDEKDLPEQIQTRDTSPNQPKPSTSIVKAPTIPADWKSFTDTDPQFGFKTTLSLPPGFSFRFTGSEFTIQNDSTATELWDYSSSVFAGNAGTKNYYDGTSRRDWYRRKLDGEFAMSDEYQKKRGDILSASEISTGSTSYLKLKVKDMSGLVTTRFLYVQNGIVHIFMPASEEASTASAKFPPYVGTVFLSLRSALTK